MGFFWGFLVCYLIAAALEFRTAYWFHKNVKPAQHWCWLVITALIWPYAMWVNGNGSK